MKNALNTTYYTQHLTFPRQHSQHTIAVLRECEQSTQCGQWPQ